MLDPERYFHANPTELKERYIEVCCELANLYLQLHDAEMAERKVYDHAFFSAETPTISGKERYAKTSSYDEWTTVGDCRADIASLECERDMLIRLWSNL